MSIVNLFFLAFLVSLGKKNPDFLLEIALIPVNYLACGMIFGEMRPKWGATASSKPQLFSSSSIK